MLRKKDRSMAICRSVDPETITERDPPPTALLEERSASSARNRATGTRHFLPVEKKIVSAEGIVG
jgi:hypothetical protein